MLSFLFRKSPLPPGTVVNRGFGTFTPARWDGVVVADLGDEVLVEWPKLGLARERKRQLTAVDLVESKVLPAHPKRRLARVLSPSGAHA